MKLYPHKFLVYLPKPKKNLKNMYQSVWKECVSVCQPRLARLWLWVLRGDLIHSSQVATMAATRSKKRNDGITVYYFLWQKSRYGVSASLLHSRRRHHNLGGIPISHQPCLLIKLLLIIRMPSSCESRYNFVWVIMKLNWGKSIHFIILAIINIYIVGTCINPQRNIPSV